MLGCHCLDWTSLSCWAGPACRWSPPWGVRRNAHFGCGSPSRRRAPGGRPLVMAMVLGFWTRSTPSVCWLCTQPWTAARRQERPKWRSAAPTLCSSQMHACTSESTPCSSGFPSSSPALLSTQRGFLPGWSSNAVKTIPWVCASGSPPGMSESDSNLRMWMEIHCFPRAHLHLPPLHVHLRWRMGFDPTDSSPIVVVPQGGIIGLSAAKRSEVFPKFMFWGLLQQHSKPGSWYTHKKNHSPW